MAPLVKAIIGATSKAGQFGMFIRAAYRRAPQ